MSDLTFYTNDNLSKLKGMDRQVSVHFDNASATDVLKWLSKQNVNFVANVDKLPKSRVSMNVNNVPLHEALEAVAESLGGSWNRVAASSTRGRRLTSPTLFKKMPCRPSTHHTAWSISSGSSRG